jgi:site-specific recombinase XerD
MVSKRIGFYKLTNGKYQVSHRDLDNNRIRRHFKSLRGAKIYVDRINLNNSKQGAVAPQQGSKTLLERLNEYTESNPDSAVLNLTKGVYDSFISHFGSLHPNDLSKIICGQWIEAMKQEKKYTSRTLRTIKYSITPFFDYMVENQIIERNYLADVYIKLGTRSKQRVFLSQEELIEIMNRLKVLSPTTTYPVLYFLMHTGCKISEALKLTWDEVDLEKCTVSFPRTDSSNARTLNLSVYVVEMLQHQPRINDLVFLSEQAEGWTPTAFYKFMAIDRAVINLQRHWDSFSFRHSFAFHFLKSGKTLHQLQVVLGHRQIAQTVQFYGDI